jgi:hypothetical protein
MSIDQAYIDKVNYHVLLNELDWLTRQYQREWERCKQKGIDPQRSFAIETMNVELHLLKHEIAEAGKRLPPEGK